MTAGQSVLLGPRFLFGSQHRLVIYGGRDSRQDCSLVIIMRGFDMCDSDGYMGHTLPLRIAMVDHESAARAFDRAVVDVDVDDAEGSRALRETPRRCRAETTFMYWSAGICP